MAAGIPFSDEVAVVMSRFLMCREAKEMHSVCRDAWSIYARADVFHALRWLLWQVRVVLVVMCVVESIDASSVLLLIVLCIQ